MPEGPIKYSDLFQKDDSISTLIAQLNELSSTYKALLDGITAKAKAMSTALQTVSATSSEGQKAIREASGLAEKLAKEEQKLAEAYTESAAELAKKHAEVKKANNINKLEAQIANTLEGSYDNLSARYSRIKIELNAMSEEQRKATESGRALEKEAAELYAKMNDFQKATGKHQLDVGNYGIAVTNLASDIRNAVQALTQMRLEMAEMEAAGEQGTEGYRELSDNYEKLTKDLSRLKKEYSIVKLETQAMASPLGELNDVMGALGAANGGVSVYIGALNLLGFSTDRATEAQTKLQSIMALTNGIASIYNNIFKQGNFLHAIRLAQAKLLTRATQLETSTTIGATIAQRALNLVAKANPYILLASAIGAVTVALIAFSDKSAKAAKAQKELLEVQSGFFDYLKVLEEYYTFDLKNQQQLIEGEIKLAKARNAGYAETDALEGKLLDNRKAILSQQKKIYRQDIDNINSLRDEYKRLGAILAEIKPLEDVKGHKVTIQLDEEGPAERFNVKKAVELVQEKFDQIGARIDVAAGIIFDENELENDIDVFLETIHQHLLEIEDIERAAIREANAVALDLIDQRFDKERQLARENTENQIKDIEIRLEREENLTVNARMALNEEIINLQEQLSRKIQNINEEEAAANLQAYRDLQDAKLRASAEGSERQREELRLGYDRQIEDLRIALMTNEQLTQKEFDSMVKQMELLVKEYAEAARQLELQIALDNLDMQKTALSNELALYSQNTRAEMETRLQMMEIEHQEEIVRNQQLAEELRQDELDIDKKWFRKIKMERIKSEIDIQRSIASARRRLEDAQYESVGHSTYTRYRHQLRQQLGDLAAEYEEWAKQMEVLTGEAKEVAKINMEAISQEIANANKQLRTQKGPASSLLDILGLDDDAADAIYTVRDSVIDALSQIADAKVEAAQKAVDAAETEVDAAQSSLDAEIKRRNEGYAANVADARRNLALAKAEQEEALRVQRDAQKEQESINTASQISDLATASAKIWGQLGFPWAIAAIATMWGSFAVAKTKAAQIAKESYGEGTVELLQGGSHQSGHDISLGYKADGTERRAEGGEYFAVINKRNSRKYGKEIPDIINALNAGNFEQIYSKGNGLANVVNVSSNTDVSGIRSDIQQLISQGNDRVYVDSEGNTVIQFGNIRRTIRKMVN